MNRMVKMVAGASFGMFVGSFAADGLPAEVGGRDLAGVLANSPRRIQLNLLRTLSADQLVDALNEGLAENNTTAELGAVKPQVEALATIMKSFKEVKEKDVITLDFVDGATRVGLNGDAKGNIGGEAFNQALTKVWLGDKPVQADLKKSLLGA